jgi:RHS repeat-associated protein
VKRAAEASGVTVQILAFMDDDRLLTTPHGTITYDAAGRPTAYPISSTVTRYFSWDYDDRLLGYSNTSGGAYVEAHKYNGAGARVEFSSGGTTRKDLRTGIGVTAPVVSSAVGGSTTVSYLPGIAEKRGSTKSYQHSGLKNVDAQSNASAAISATREYDAFGGVITGSGTTGTFNGPFGHAGDFGYQSEGSGLQLLGHRWYDPEVGRFLTRDPIKDGKNWYAYCENNPLGRVDPNGLEWHDPLQIRVDPSFEGTVIAVGEPKRGAKHGKVRLRGGEATDPNIDVDYVIIYDKNGKLIDIVFLTGTARPGDGKEERQQATINKDGSIKGGGMHIRPGDGSNLADILDHRSLPGGKQLREGEDKWIGNLIDGLRNPLKDGVVRVPSRPRHGPNRRGGHG